MRALPWITLFVIGCADASEAPQVEMPVVVDRAGMTPVVTDLGYEIEVDQARVVWRDLVFTVAGEVHATSSLWQRVSDALIPPAQAHPGHFQGGEVTGELRGTHILNWGDDTSTMALGTATLLAGKYSAANVTLGRATEADVSPQDPLLGHTAVLTGTATRAGVSTTFTLVIDSPEDRVLLGIPFVANVGAEARGTLGARMDLQHAPGATMLDGIDFATLDADSDGAVEITPDTPNAQDAYNVFRRTFQTHDPYIITYTE